MNKLKYLYLLLLLGVTLPLHAQKILNLDDAMAIAVKHSPDLIASRLNLERTSESLNAKRASMKSQFSLNLNPLQYSQSREFNDLISQWNTTENFQTYGTFTVEQPILLTDGTISLNNRFGWRNSYSEYSGVRDKSFYNDLYLSLTQPLFTYNRQKMELKQLELDNENAMLSYAMQRLNLEKNVSQFFYNVYLAQMSLNIKEDEYKNTQKSYDIIKNKVDAGLAAQEELYQAEVNLETARSDRDNQRVTLENYKDQFKQYIGMDIYEDITVMTDVEVKPVAVDQQKAIQHGLASRMEIRQREINVQNSQFDLIQVKAANEFRGDVSITYGLLGDNQELKDVYRNPTRNPRVNVAFNIPLWDWGEKKAQIKAQEAVIKTQELNLSNEKVQITLDIRQVVRSLQNMKNQIDIAKINEKNAQLTYDINLERYQNGDLTSMDLNLYQTQLSEKKMAYAQSLIDYRIELLNLKVQTLYDFEAKKSVVPEEFLKEYRDSQTK